MPATATAPLEQKQHFIGKVLAVLPGLHTMPPGIVRGLYLALDRSLGLKKQTMARLQTLSIPLSSEPGKQISARAYYPGHDKHYKAMVYFHGGGCVIGSASTHDRFCRYLARKNNIAIISVNYRLAPECKFPQAIIDAIEAWNWVNKHCAQLQLEKDAIGVGGDSAGAYLSALVGLPGLHKPLPVSSAFKPAYQMLLYPMLDLRAMGASYEENQSERILTKAVMHYFRDHYLNSPQEVNNPLASPLLASDLSEAPKTYLLTLGHDPLRDEGLAFADRLQDQGGELVHQHYADCMHSFISVARFSQRAQQASDQLCDAINNLIYQ